MAYNSPGRKRLLATAPLAAVALFLAAPSVSAAPAKPAPAAPKKPAPPLSSGSAGDALNTGSAGVGTGSAAVETGSAWTNSAGGDEAFR